MFGGLHPAVASQNTHKSHHHLHGNHRRTHHAVDDAGSAQDTLHEALKALRVANKLRVENVQSNNYQLRTAAGSAGEKSEHSSVPLLDYLDATGGESLVKARLESTNRSGTIEPKLKYGYSLSPQLIQAAKEIAESQPPTPSDVDYAAIARKVRAKYSLANNDTNSMPQKLIGPDGLSEYVPYEHTSRELQQPLQRETSGRAAAPYWMAEMEQNGVSPFAPPDYKVWRNVRDYGAKGDGVTDDTEAINRAISDEGRCGSKCGSSTIYPATIWFPAGTYLVSSSIIQYYNTQFLGDPTAMPTILAASSFVGLGVITTDVYVGESEEWYLNTNNFLRSIRNFKIDITRTDQSAYVCGIHWQVAQGTSLENIEFYMLQGVEGNTQQGIYMENGSGGFMADLTFVGGNFGAYLGNQQFTTSHLVFVNCKTALQIHWDWAWTMQDVVIESCDTGIVVVGGAGGPLSTGQSLGSLILVDAIVANTPSGIVTSLFAENSTSLLLQNVGFFNVKTAVEDTVLGQALLDGGNEVFIDNWGFGRVTNSTGSATEFVNAANIPVMNRTRSLLSTELAYVKANFYTRRRPKYTDVPMNKIINIKTAGAKGDGKTDDTTALNTIFTAAANMSSIVYIPFGVYLITDTVKIPVGSRIIGQAWPQFMATGKKFGDQTVPRAAVQVGDPGDIGVVEIQDVMFTVSGATAGAVLLEWNIHESTQGSAGLWDSHFRVGGAIGSNLQAEQCPKGGGINTNCIAASTLLHLTHGSSAYLENVWVWTADHDLDAPDESQIDIFTGRGVLIESTGPTWLYGTASEHNVLYQYQLSNASNILMGMIQTESPYYQAHPGAPLPIVTGSFANDPTFADCSLGSNTCPVSWAVRIVDSSTIYLLGAGLYSWFSEYSQGCLETEDCQEKGFEVEQTSDLWVYNLVTKAIVEMISPVNEVPTLANDNQNGFMSSILAWLKGSDDITGQRNFTGFTIFDREGLSSAFRDSCVTALTATIKCDEEVFSFWKVSYHGGVRYGSETDVVCDAGCGASLANWFHNVEKACDGYTMFNRPLTLFGGNMWAGWNETCLKDPTTGFYCNDVINNFTLVASFEDMPHDELCSYCYVTKLKMMQSSLHSLYDEYYQEQLEYIVTECGISANTTIPKRLEPEEPEEEPICLSGKNYTTREGDTCTSIALEHSVASAALYMGNQDLIQNCNDPLVGKNLCLPLSCEHTYLLQPNDTCYSIEADHSDIMFDAATGTITSLRQVNPWIDTYCLNLQATSDAWGRVLCLSPQGGVFNATEPVPTSSRPGAEHTGYGPYPIIPPENATVANGTTLRCGHWTTVADGDTCAGVCLQNKITRALFLEVNPSLDPKKCTDSLVPGLTYCTAPTRAWNYTSTSL